MTRSLTSRIVLIAFFLGINLILGVYFLMTVRGQSLVPEPWQDLLHQYGLIKVEKGSVSLDTAPDYSVRIDLDSESVIGAINGNRIERSQSVLANSARLHDAAEIVLTAVTDQNFKLDEEKGDSMLADALKKAGYNYSSAYQSIVIGPISSKSVVDYWFANNQEDVVLASDVTEIGVATAVETMEGDFSGITVVIVAQPRGVTALKTPAPAQATRPALPQISDAEVMTALNSYRQAHGIHTLNMDDNLCTYAQKRVEDLVAYGGLDNHKGFEADFADTSDPPESIKNYSGSRIGENLAHQFCKNMTTGDSFVAETGTALIEWCFDSSTKGHREAQLSTDFRNVCVKHADGMYVVIFGD